MYSSFCFILIRIEEQAEILNLNLRRFGEILKCIREPTPSAY